MSWTEWLLAVVATLLVGIACYYIDEHDKKTIITQEIIVHGHSSSN